MANEVKLRVQLREMTGKQTRKLRAQGLTPGNISGGGKPSIAIQMSQRELIQILKRHGSPVLRISVDPGGPTDTALLAKVERDAISAAILHVDFRRVNLAAPIKARVPLRATGDSPAVKDYNGVLLHLMESVEVEALPANLPDSIAVDISGLVELNSTLTGKDIVAPANVQVHVAPDEPVIIVKPPRVEVEVVEEQPAAEELAPSAAGEAAEAAEAEPTEASESAEATND